MTARDELLEAAGFLETHGALPEELATPAVREVVTPLLPGDRVDIVLALQAAAERDRTAAAPFTPEEAATLAAFDAAPALAETSPLTVAMLALAEELEAAGERAYQRSCGAYRDELSAGQHLAYEAAADDLRTTLASVLAADPEPREAVVERMARAMWPAASGGPEIPWAQLNELTQEHYRRLAAAALDASRGGSA